MTNYINYLAAIHQILMDDATLCGLVDCQIHTGVNPTRMNDTFLEEDHQTCILLESPSKTSKGLPGVAYHENSEHDQLIRFTVVSKSETYAANVAGRVEDLIKVAPTKTLNSTIYQILPSGINIRTNILDQFPDRVFVIGEVRIKYYG